MAVRFSTTELKVLQNIKFFEVKAAAIKKIDAQLANVRDVLKSEIENQKIVFPKEVDARTGKIFRGENYLGLPYLVLDYPKCFSKNSVYAFRTMFWWGNFYSCTLHLQGNALEENRNKLVAKIKLLKNKNVHICMNSEPWQYHYKKDNYVSIDKLSATELRKYFLKNKFVKLSRKIMVKDYKKLSTFSIESFKLFNIA